MVLSGGRLAAGPVALLSNYGWPYPHTKIPLLLKISPISVVTASDIQELSFHFQVKVSYLLFYRRLRFRNLEIYAHRDPSSIPPRNVSQINITMGFLVGRIGTTKKTIVYHGVS